MRAFLDANLLIYLNTITDKSLRLVYENLYTKVVDEHRLYTDVLVLDEVIYVSRKRYNVPFRVTLEFLNEIVKPFVNVISLGEEEYDIAANIISEHNIVPSDALHLGAMKNNNIATIVSEDRELDKIGWVKRVWLTTP